MKIWFLINTFLSMHVTLTMCNFTVITQVKCCGFSSLLKDEIHEVECARSSCGKPIWVNELQSKLCCIQDQQLWHKTEILFWILGKRYFKAEY